MNKAELLAENTRLRLALVRPERSRFTQLRADLIKENREMQAELDRYQPPPETKRPGKTPPPLRGFRRLRQRLSEVPVTAVDLRTIYRRVNLGEYGNKKLPVLRVSVEIERVWYILIEEPTDHAGVIAHTVELKNFLSDQLLPPLPRRRKKGDAAARPRS